MKKIITIASALILSLSYVSLSSTKVKAAVSLKDMDYNLNGVIDQGDMDILSGYYNVTSKDSRFNPKFDLNQDNIIDLYDIVKISANIGEIAIDYRTNITSKFTDSNLRNVVYTLIGKKSPSPILFSDVTNIKELNLSNKNISNLGGVEYFSSLTKLDCSNNKITTIDLNHNPFLTSLLCNNNKLATLDLSNKSLTTLNCNNNELKTLYLGSDKFNRSSFESQYTDSSRNNISKDLVITTDNTNITSKFTDENFKKCIYKLLNKASSLPILYSEIKNIKVLNIPMSNISNLNGIEYFSSLTTLNCSNNQITTLNLSSNSLITSLHSEKNKLTDIKVNRNANLIELYCGNNNLTSLDTSENRALTKLDCSSNALLSLNISSNTKLTSLACEYNKLKSLNVTNNIALNKLNCENNSLTSLDLSKNKLLAELSCCYNEIKLLYDSLNRWDDYSFIFQYTDESHNNMSNDLKITIKN